MQAVGAIIIAAIIFLLFFFVFSLKGPWRGWWPFLLILLLVVWASAYYIDPVGPENWEVYWIPLIFVGLIFALLIASLPPSSEEEVTESGVDEVARSEGSTSTGLSAFFWILLILLAIAVIVGYWNY